jgi:hypothetical protein
MSHEIEHQPCSAALECVSGSDVSSSVFSVLEHGWEPARLPELATNGFPFAPPFIVRAPAGTPPPDACASTVLPFGFHFRIHKTSPTHPVIDLTRGFYDPQTQLYTVPLRAGGDTEGDEFETGYWTDQGDGKNPNKSWDTMSDRESD